MKNKEAIDLENILYDKNLSVKQASRIAGVGHKTIYRWLSGEASPNPVIYRKALRKLKEAKVNL
jgi:hypothetical protein